MDDLPETLKLLLSVRDAQHFDTLAVRLLVQEGQRRKSASPRLLVADILKELRNLKAAAVDGLLASCTGDRAFLRGVLLVFWVPDPEQRTEEQQQLAEEGYQLLFHDASQAFEPTAAALLGLIQDQGLRRKDCQDAQLAQNLYRHALDWHGLLGRMFWAESVEMTTGDGSDQDVSAPTTAAQGVSQSEDVTDDGLDDLLRECIPVDVLQAPAASLADPELVTAFKQQLMLDEAKENQNYLIGGPAGGMGASGLRAIPSSGSMDVPRLGSSSVASNTNYGSFGASPPGSRGRTPTPAFSNPFHGLDPVQSKVVPGGDVRKVLPETVMESADRLVPTRDLAFNKVSVTSAPFVGSAGLRAADLGVNGFAGSVKDLSTMPPYSQAPGVGQATTAHDSFVVHQLPDDVLLRISRACGIEVPHVEQYLAMYEKANGLEKTVAHVRRLALHEGFANGAGPAGGLPAGGSNPEALQRLLVEQQLRAGLPSTHRTGANAAFRQTQGFNAPVGMRPAGLNGNMTGVGVGYAPNTPRGRVGGGRGVDNQAMFNGLGQRALGGAGLNGAANMPGFANLAGLTAAQLQQLVQQQQRQNLAMPAGVNGRIDNLSQVPDMELYRAYLQQLHQKAVVQDAALNGQALGRDSMFNTDATANLLNQDLLRAHYQTSQQQMRHQEAAAQARMLQTQRNLAALQQLDNFQVKNAVLNNIPGLGNVNPTILEDLLRRRAGLHPQGLNGDLGLGLNGGINGRMGMPQSNMNVQPGSRVNRF